MLKLKPQNPEFFNNEIPRNYNQHNNNSSNDMYDIFSDSFFQYAF